jgi:hypothetical protein
VIVDYVLLRSINFYNRKKRGEGEIKRDEISYSITKKILAAIRIN